MHAQARQLHIAEIEFAVLTNMWLRQRVGNEDTLRHIVTANVATHKCLAHLIKWRFTTNNARTKFCRLDLLPSSFNLTDY